MAEEPLYSSRADAKRKFEDPAAPPPHPRRPTGFSAQISDAPAATIPVDEIELAKQRAQEIASRIFSSVEAKRPKLENGGGGDDFGSKGFSSAGPDYSLKSLAQSSPSQGGTAHLSSFPAYGFQGSSKKIEIPNGRVGVIIGKGGETIKYLQQQSGAKIQVTRDMDHNPNSQTRPVELVGTPEQISRAEQLITDVLAEAEIGASGTNAPRKFGTTSFGGEPFIMKVPNNKVGLIIGKGGETIKSMQAKSGARIQLIPLHPPPGDTSTERTVQIEGTNEQIELAKQLVNEVTSEGASNFFLGYDGAPEFDSTLVDGSFTINLDPMLVPIFEKNRFRNPQMSGGYSQQGYRPPRPPTSWGPPGAPQMQQPGYGYMQPGAYTGAPPPYTMPQQPYPGYPPPAAPTTGWDQTSNPAAQQTTPLAGYDYYNQQPSLPQNQQPPTPASSTLADTATYNYSQSPATSYNSQGGYGDPTYPQQQVYGQTYGQDGYSGGYNAPTHQQGYPQAVSNSQTGYDQQGYYGTVQTSYGAPVNQIQDGSAQTAYGSTVSQTQDGSAPTYSAPGVPAQVPPAQSVQPSTTQQGYVAVAQQPSSTPASYPSQGATQAGYGPSATPQPGYVSQPLAQSGYSQPTPSTQPSYLQPAAAQVGHSPSQPGAPAQSGYGQDATQYHPPGLAPGGPQQAYAQQQPLVGVQPGYGQPYGSGGYSQPASYSSDNSVAAVQPAASGVTKASPQS